MCDPLQFRIALLWQSLGPRYFLWRWLQKAGDYRQFGRIRTELVQHLILSFGKGLAGLFAEIDDRLGHIRRIQIRASSGSMIHLNGGASSASQRSS